MGTREAATKIRAVTFRPGPLQGLRGGWGRGAPSARPPSPGSSAQLALHLLMGPLPPGEKETSHRDRHDPPPPASLHQGILPVALGTRSFFEKWLSGNLARWPFPPPQPHPLRNLSSAPPDPSAASLDRGRGAPGSPRARQHPCPREACRGGEEGLRRGAPQHRGLQGTKVSVGQEPLSISGAPGSVQGVQRAQGPWLSQGVASPQTSPLPGGRSNGLPQARL